jgi:hypothetical protein
MTVQILGKEEKRRDLAIKLMLKKEKKKAEKQRIEKENH